VLQDLGIKRFEGCVRRGEGNHVINCGIVLFEFIYFPAYSWRKFPNKIRQPPQNIFKKDISYEFLSAGS
jgi:hypothetical protein